MMSNHTAVLKLKALDRDSGARDIRVNQNLAEE